MPHNVASDQGLQCLLTGFSIKKIEYRQQNRPDTPKMTNGLIKYITVEESTSIQWVKTRSEQSAIKPDFFSHIQSSDNHSFNMPQLSSLVKYNTDSSMKHENSLIIVTQPSAHTLKFRPVIYFCHKVGHFYPQFRA